MLLAVALASPCIVPPLFLVDLKTWVKRCVDVLACFGTLSAVLDAGLREGDACKANCSGIEVIRRKQYKIEHFFSAATYASYK